MEDLSFEIKIINKDGYVRREYKRKAYSYLKQWNQIIAWMAQASDKSITDTGGTARQCDRSAIDINTMRIDGAASAGPPTNKGIMIGTGSTAVAINDYSLDTEITDGNGAGQMEYQAQTVAASQTVGTVQQFSTTRAFVNQSGDTITVWELGVYCLVEDNGANSRYFCIIRDVLTAGEDVADGETLTVTYTQKATV